MTEMNEYFSYIDYIIVISLLSVSFFIGILSAAFKGNRSPEEFLLGNRSLNHVAVAMSLITSFVSAVHLIGFTTEVYLHGTQLSLLAIGCIIGISAALFFIIPVIYPLKLISIFEYIEMRFRSQNLQVLFAIVIFINVNIQIGACLYATSIALATFTPFSFTTCTLVMGSVCTIYSAVGGIRAVVWTDVFQLIIVIIGLLMFVIAGVMQTEGIGSILSIAEEGGRIQFFNMNPSLYERHNFYNTIAFGTFYYAAVCSNAQVNMQRICAVKTLSEAKRVLRYSMIGFVFFYVIIFFGGLIIYASYAGCDPLLEGKIEKYSQILPYFIVNRLGQIFGLPGIFAATIISSTLSTFSSLVNAQVAIIWKNILVKFKIFSEDDPLKSVLANKITTCIFGAMFIGMAFVTERAKNIIQLVLSMTGVCAGVFFGITILGVCVPFSNKRGAWTGVITAYSFLAWIYIGSLKYGEPPERLPLTTDSCPYSLTTNETPIELTASSTDKFNVFIAQNITENLTITGLEEFEEFPLLYLYRISYTLYIVLGPVLVVIIGALVSYVAGKSSDEEIPNEHLVFDWSRIFPKSNNKQKQSEDLQKINL